MKRKLMGIVVFCFAATFLIAAQEDGKGALESFKKHLADVQAEWDSTVSEVKEVKGKKHQYDSIPEKLVRAKGNAQSILKKIEARQDELVKTKVPPELVSERDALLAQSRSLAEVLNSYIKQDVREATDKTLDDIRRSADDHIADSDRAWSPVAISLYSPFQWPRAEADIMGLGLNVFAGEYHNVYGVDIATIENVVSNCAAGIQLAGFFNESDTAYGYQLAAFKNSANELVGGQVSLVNINKCYGSWLQVGGLVNSSGFFEGAQVAGFGNFAYSCKGLQIGVGNHAGKLFGFQIGFGNDAEKLSGFQIGAINLASEMSGFQIGAFNSDAFNENNKKKVKLSGFRSALSTTRRNCPVFRSALATMRGNCSAFRSAPRSTQLRNCLAFRSTFLATLWIRNCPAFRSALATMRRNCPVFRSALSTLRRRNCPAFRLAFSTLPSRRTDCRWAC